MNGSRCLGFLVCWVMVASGCSDETKDAENTSSAQQALTPFCSGKADGTACNDYDPLTQNDFCRSGSCVAGAIPDSPRPPSPDIASYPASCVRAKTTYSVLVKTGDAANADTRAGITLQLRGDASGAGRTSTSNLTLGSRLLSRNSKYSQSFTNVTSVGELAELKLTQNRAGTSPSWLVDWVEVHDSCSGRRYRFDLHRWLGKDDALEAPTSAVTRVSTGGSVHRIKLRPVFLAPADATHQTATPNGNAVLNAGVGYGRGCLAGKNQNGYVEPVAGYGGPVNANDWADMLRVLKVAQRQWEQLLGVAAGKAFEIDIPPAPLVVSCENNAYLTDSEGGGAAAFARQIGELLRVEGTDRYDSNTIYAIVYWRPWDQGYLAAGGRTFNGAPGTGAGGFYLDFWDFRYSSLLLSTMVHEIGHALGLTHVDVYGESMDSSPSVMSYNPANNSLDRFTPSPTPGQLLDVERTKLLANPEALPGYTVDPATIARGQSTPGYHVNLGPMSVPLTERGGQGYRILDPSGAVASGPETITWNLTDSIRHCQNVMGFNQYYTYEFDVAGYRRICKGYELYFNGELVGYEPTWGMGAGIDNCLWNLTNNPTRQPTCFFNEVNITAFARAIQGPPSASVNIFEYDQRTVYPLAFGPTASRCQAIGAAAGSNMFACFVGSARAY